MKMFNKAKVNVNLLIFLLNKKFFKKWEERHSLGFCGVASSHTPVYNQETERRFIPNDQDATFEASLNLTKFDWLYISLSGTSLYTPVCAVITELVLCLQCCLFLCPYNLTKVILFYFTWHFYACLYDTNQAEWVACLPLCNTLMGHPLPTPVLISHYSIWMRCRVRHLTLVSLFVWEHVCFSLIWRSDTSVFLSYLGLFLGIQTTLSYLLLKGLTLSGLRSGSLVTCLVVMFSCTEVWPINTSWSIPVNISYHFLLLLSLLQ